MVKGDVDVDVDVEVGIDETVEVGKDVDLRL